MSNKGLNLDVSLFERLVKRGFPFATLSTQHRMRPEISAFIRGTYPKARHQKETHTLLLHSPVSSHHSVVW